MNIIIGNAWPYANGPLHLGRIAVWLPGDILARYHRLMGDNVVFVSGTDCHGLPVVTKAKEENITPTEAVQKYHKEFKRCFELLEFSFDDFDKTHSEYHKEKVQKFILDLYKKGYIYEKEIEETFCENCNEYLADKNIIGNCPICGEKAYGYGCTKCDSKYEAYEVKNKKCTICGSKPILKKNKHLFFALSKLENNVKRMYEESDFWRENAKSIVERYLKEGLRDRKVTRNLDWGISVPLEGYDDKKIYVWIEALMGYITASMKCLEERNEHWKSYWQGEDSRVYFVHGKDNIPFHTVIFPAILFGIGIKEPNLRIISSEHLTLEGKPFSSNKNWAIWADYIVKRYNVDSFRYYLTINSPEKSNSDFTWREYIYTNNNDLVNTLDSYINRVCLFVEKNTQRRMPSSTIDNNIKQEIFDLYFTVGDSIEDGEFKEALILIMNFVKKYNKIFQESNLWELRNESVKRCNEIAYNHIQIIANLANLLEPFMPSTSEKIRKTLNISNSMWSYIEKNSGKIGERNRLFVKIDKNRIVEEMNNLKENKN